MKRKILSIVLALVLILSLLPVMALAAFTDVQNHWAQEAIDKWSGLGIITGSGGNFRPEDPITRGEMAVIIDRLMKYQTAAPNTFTDLDQNFYTDAILKANAAGIITGYNGKVRPLDHITREEAIVMFGRAFGLAESSAASGFNDSASVSSWARGYVNAMAAKGYISGSGGMFNPQSPITRAQIVTILNNAISGLYTEAKEYTGNVSGVAIVNTSGVVLKDMTITGDLIIAEGVGSGEVTLTNVKVTGNTMVRGGGPNSIIINGGSQLENLIIEKTDDGNIRIVKEDGTVVDAVYIDDGNDEIILKGSFKSVTISAEITLRLAANSTIDELMIEDEAAGSIIINEGTIKQAFVNDPLTDGQGDDDVTFQGIQPLKISPLVLGDTDKPSSSSGGGGFTDVAVTGITVDKTEMLLVVNDGATGTIVATVSPSNATNKTVTWTSSAPAVATVLNGVVSPVGSGTAVITATTVNGKTATVTVTVGKLISTGTIQAAIAAAADDAIIVVAAGEYSEELTINKPITLISQENHAAKISGTITITADAVTVKGFEVTAPAGYTAAPVIHMIGADGINIINNKVVATGYGAIGTSTGPAKVTGTISGNIVTGMIIVGTDGALTVSNNIVTANTTSSEGICFYPVGSTAVLTITGNTVSGVSGSNKDIKVNERPASINGITDDSAMEANIKGANSIATVKLSWIKIIDNEEKLADAIAAQADGQVWLVNGTIGSSSSFTLYEITKKVSIIGTGSPKPVIYGTFHVYANGVSFDNLVIRNKGGRSEDNTQQKAAIDVLATQVKITNCDFLMGETVPSNQVANGVTIWPLGTAPFSLEMSGNTFVGYDAETGNWSSCAFQITENISVNTSRFTKATAIYGASPKTVQVDATADYLSPIAVSNTYQQCSNNFIYQDWSNYVPSAPETSDHYKFVYATTVDALTSGIKYSSDGATIRLAAGPYALDSQIRINKAINIIGAGDTTIITKGTTPWTNATGSKGHAPLITIDSGANAVILESIKVTGAANIAMTPSGTDYGSGINVVNSSNVVLNNVTSANNAAAGLIVNSSMVVADNLNTEGNGWGAVNVDISSGGAGSASVFTLSNSTLGEAQQIWSDGANVTATATVTVNAAGFTGYKNHGSNAAYWSTTAPNPYPAVTITKAATSTESAMTTIYLTIQDAINAASGGDTINVASGTYTGNFAINKSITLQGVSSNGQQPVISGKIDPANAHGAYTITIDNFKFELEAGDYAYSSCSTYLSTGSVITFSNNTFVANAAGNFAAIYIDAIGGNTYNVNNNTFVGAIGATEGAIDIDLTYGGSTVTVNDNIFTALDSNCAGVHTFVKEGVSNTFDCNADDSLYVKTTTLP